MRNLRAIYNQAKNKDIVDTAHYPFRRYKIKSEKVVPHVMTKDKMRCFLALQVNFMLTIYMKEPQTGQTMKPSVRLTGVVTRHGF